MPPPWHRVVVPPGAEGVPTVGVTVTVRDADDELPHGFTASTETVAVPEYPDAHVTVADEPVPETVLPEPVTLHV